MLRHLSIAVVLTVATGALAQDKLPPIPRGFAGADRKMLEAGFEAIASRPDLYFYVCTNAYSQKILRSSRKPLDTPHGRHPDRPAPLKDIVLDSFGGKPSADAEIFLEGQCRKHNELLAFRNKVPPKAAPSVPAAASKPSQPSNRSRSSAEPRATASAMAKLPRELDTPLDPLPPSVKRPGERFSSEAIELFSIIGGRYELNGKPVTRGRSSDEEILADGRTIANLTQSKDPDLRQAALLTCVLYGLRAEYRQTAAGQNADLQNALYRRLDTVARRAIDAGQLDLEQEFANLSRDGEGGLLGDSLGDFGRVLQALLITDEFRNHNKLQRQALIMGAFSAAARRRAEKMAGAVPASSATTKPIQVLVEYQQGQAPRLKVSNRAGKPLHHVLVITRSTADPVLVQRAARMQRVIGGLAEYMELFPKETLEEMPDAVDLWEQIQVLDHGSVIFLEELPQAATITMPLCDEQRFKLSKDAGVSIWADETAALDVRPGNWAKVVEAANTPPPPKTFEFKPFVPPIVERPKLPPPKTKAEAAARAKKETENRKIAVLSINLAKQCLARKDIHMAKVYLVQAINMAPDSSAGKQAKTLLKNLEEKEEPK